MKNNITILIVDDEMMMRNLLKKILRRDGFKVILAEDGEDALRILGNSKVDLIICDMKMPNMSGLELLRIVKDKYPRIGMIMITAYGDAYSVTDALLLGADEYITKPFKGHEISLVVERAYWRILSTPASIVNETDRGNP